MKRLFFVIAVSTFIFTAFARPATKVRKLTEEQKQELIMIKVGGFVVQPIKTTIVRIYNNQQAVPVDVIDDIASNLRKGPNFPVEIVSGAWQSFPKKDKGVGFVIEVFEDVESPTKMICAPDDGWVRVNIAPFNGDKPSSKKLSERVRREVWRGVAYSLGAGNTHNPMCPLKPASSIKELDELSGIVPSPEVLDVMTKWAKKWGINAYRKTTYRRACQEGWAPAPTNEYQKAIWDEIHSMPSSPIKILPESVRRKK
jgi:hypothetical protein